ncbi:MAG: hypothetical protein M1823_005066 [Watsoniomyces obsoletus]|nr:MAG: hypothetical protein M1823_005066 [Watsoniomyces obsoletus]
MANTPPGGARPPKVMSSRLMTMKFMQRAAAVEPSPQSPQEEPSAKRRKVSAQDEAIRAEIAIEEGKRAEAIARHAAQAGETRWAFSLLNSTPVFGASDTQGPSNVVTAGYASIDNGLASVEELEDEIAASLQQRANNGRRRFGAFEEKKETSDTSSDEDSGNSNKADEDNPTDMETLIADAKKEARRASRKKRRAQQSDPISPERSAKKVKLNKLTSISGVKSSTKSGTDDSKIQCFRCKKTGHRIKDCPNGGQKGHSN